MHIHNYITINNNNNNNNNNNGTTLHIHNITLQILGLPDH